MAARGIDVSHEIIDGWTKKFGRLRAAAEEAPADAVTRMTSRRDGLLGGRRMHHRRPWTTKARSLTS